MQAQFIGTFKDANGDANAVYRRFSRYSPEGEPVFEGWFDVREADGTWLVFEALPKSWTLQ